VKCRQSVRVIVASLAMLLMASLASATEVDEPEFEVVSIRPVAPNTPGVLRSADFTPILPGGRFIDSRANLLDMIRIAYDVEHPDKHLLGLPKWAHEKQFSVWARPAEGFPVLPPEQNEKVVKTMLRKMLAKHFQLKIHEKTRVEPIYRLEVAKEGLRIPEVVPSHPPVKPGLVNMAVGDQSGRIIGRQVTMQGLAAALSVFFDHPVQDHTELKGYYDLDIYWKSTDPADAASPGGLGAVGLGMLISNLRNQLGLRLERANGPVKCWIVDHLALPAGN